jgi:uncharacterized metal-binding protein
MPAGRIHDRITLWSLPLVAGLTIVLTHNGTLTLLLCGGYLLGGLIFGPDLDIYSRQYQRWGWLRWIWLPYQKMLRHRSIFSHGFLVGTALRVVYLTLWLGGLGLLGLWLWSLGWGRGDWQGVFTTQLQTCLSWMQAGITHHVLEIGLFYLGLEVGAMSHSLADSLGSAWKRLGRYGLKGLWKRKKPKRRKKPKGKSPALR